MNHGPTWNYFKKPCVHDAEARNKGGEITKHWRGEKHADMNVQQICNKCINGGIHSPLMIQIFA